MLGGFSRLLVGGAVASAAALFVGSSAAQTPDSPAAPPVAQPSPPIEPPGPPASPAWPGQPPLPPPTFVQPPPSPPSPEGPAPHVVVMPDYPNAFGRPTPGVVKVRAHPSMMHWGIAMTTGGLLLTIVGSVITASAIDVVDIYCDGPAVCLHRDDTVKKAIGSTMLVGGAAIGAIGFPLWLYGGHMVRPPKGQTKTGTFSPDVRVGAGSAKVSFSF